MKLYNQKCIPCNGNIPPFSKSDIKIYLKKLKKWKATINKKKDIICLKIISLRTFYKA